jgi:hypothetical protein
LKGTINELDLDKPSKEEVMKALDEYKMFSPEELSGFEKEIQMPQ